MPYPRLLLVRHGAARGVSGRAVGWHDAPLAPAGRRAVEALADTWSGPPPGRLVTSDLARAEATAEILARRLGAPRSLVPVADRRLREASFGAWEGRTWEELHAADGERLAVWGRRWRRFAPPGGESFAELGRRVLAWYGEERQRLLVSGGTTVAVGHAGPFRALLAALFDLDDDRIWRLPLGTAQVSALAPVGPPPVLLWLDRAGFGTR